MDGDILFVDKKNNDHWRLILYFISSIYIKNINYSNNNCLISNNKVTLEYSNIRNKSYYKNISVHQIMF